MISALITPKLEEIGKIFEQVKNEETSGQTHVGKVNIQPTEQFNTGLKVGWDLLSGDEFTKVPLPFALRHTPSVSFEIGVKDPSTIDQAVVILNQFKEMAKAMVPQVTEVMKMGIDLQFRVHENRFFFDVVISGLIGGVLREHVEKVNFDLIKYAGLAKFHIATGFSPLMLLNQTLEEVIRNACHLEISGNGEFVNTKAVLNIVTLMLKSVSLDSSSKQMKNLYSVLNFVNVFRSLGFDLKYDPSTMLQAIKSTINLRSSQADKFSTLSEQFSGTQMMFNGFVEQGKQMAMFIADYVGLLKNLDLDNISLHLTFPIVKSSFRVYLNLPGLTPFIDTNFLG